MSRWAHQTAGAGGLALIGLGLSGVNATFTNSPPEGPLLGVLVFGSWALWGLATLAVAARLSPRRVGPRRQAPASTADVAPRPL